MNPSRLTPTQASNTSNNSSSCYSAATKANASRCIPINSLNGEKLASRLEYTRGNKDRLEKAKLLKIHGKLQTQPSIVNFEASKNNLVNIKSETADVQNTNINNTHINNTNINNTNINITNTDRSNIQSRSTPGKSSENLTIPHTETTLPSLLHDTEKLKKSLSAFSFRQKPVIRQNVNTTKSSPPSTGFRSVLNHVIGVTKRSFRLTEKPEIKLKHSDSTKTNNTHVSRSCSMPNNRNYRIGIFVVYL